MSANKGTIFLDEISETSQFLQIKLLHKEPLGVVLYLLVLAQELPYIWEI